MIKPLRPLALALVFLPAASHGQLLDYNLQGTTRTDGWENMISFVYSGVLTPPGFPGSASWTTSIEANQSGSNGGGEFIKTSLNGYPASAGVYSPFTLSGYRVFSNSPLSSAETIVFQIYMTTGEGGSALSTLPTLNLNGGTQALAANFSALTYNQMSGTVPGGGDGEPLFDQVLAYQWDLSAFDSQITSFQINFNVTSHSTIYGLQVDQSSVFAAVVPEPGSAGLFAVAAICWVMRRKKVWKNREG